MDNPKLVSRKDAAALAEGHRAAGRKVVFTNGCFDILHAGHVSYLSDAAALGDILILGLNSDASVRSIKGDKRPIVEEQNRARVLTALECIDALVLFDEPDPEDLIREIRPDILVKGADWAESEIIGADFVKSLGGKVERIPLEPGLSTTAIIRRILELHA